MPTPPDDASVPAAPPSPIEPRRVTIDDACDTCGPTSRGRTGILLRKGGAAVVLCSACLFECLGMVEAESPLTTTATTAGIRELLDVRRALGRAVDGRDPNAIITAIGLLLVDLIVHIGKLDGESATLRSYYFEVAEGLGRDIGEWVQNARDGVVLQ